jgi:hypothetical protein
VAFGNPANAGILYGMSGVIELRMKAAVESEAPPKGEEDRLVETLGVDGRESWPERVLDSLHIHVETLQPMQFLEGVRTFLSAIGLDGPTMISVDEKPLHLNSSSRGMDLRDAIDLAEKFIEEGVSPPRMIEVSTSGRNVRFLLWLNLFYWRRHRWDEAPVEVDVRAMSSELGPLQGESFADYKARMKALDLNLKKTAETYDTIQTEKNALYSDFAHHLSESFPGVRLQLFESIPLGES